MLVSKNWLTDYVDPQVSIETLTDRLTMSGLNLESFEPAGSDTVIDLEVTSNRPDCLGHLGVAREVSVLFGVPLKTPRLVPAPTAVDKLPTSTGTIQVDIQAPDLCPRFHARVIKGVKVGPSPTWMVERLAAVGIASVNNVVDITNYVAFECAQPLHAYDLGRLSGHALIVRRATAGEKIKAINQKTYELAPGMCVIADATGPVAIAGVMGGFETEIGLRTQDVLLESASFAPLAVRTTARALNLQSPSSYRFERALDESGPDWASRRAAQLILELAGGTLVDGVIAAGTAPAEPVPITLRWSQLKRILGIDVHSADAIRILVALGCTAGLTDGYQGVFTPPSFRRDLSREIDLVEEVARIYGYEKIPEDRPVPLCSSAKSQRDRVAERIRSALTACGFYESMTISFVSQAEAKLFEPHGLTEFLSVNHSTRRQENVLRPSLVPSLLKSREDNERHGTPGAQLFEIAKVYLSTDRNLPEETSEPTMVGMVSGRSFSELKGVVSACLKRINAKLNLETRTSENDAFTPGRGAEVWLNGVHAGWIGELSDSATKQIGLKDRVCIAELRFAVLEQKALLVPTYEPLPAFPGIQRDLNLILDEAITWQQVADVAAGAAGPLLAGSQFGGQYRGQQIPAGKKSYLLSLTYRSSDRTLTSEEVEERQAAVLAACKTNLGAELR